VIGICGFTEAMYVGYWSYVCAVIYWSSKFVDFLSEMYFMSFIYSFHAEYLRRVYTQCLNHVWV
jgi:hypothetical protein